MLHRLPGEVSTKRAARFLQELKALNNAASLSANFVSKIAFDTLHGNLHHLHGPE
jgi:hypothetical protein